MGDLRVGSLNVNGLRDKVKNNALLELIKLKNINVILLQETHSDYRNEVDWGLWWEGESCLSHGSNTSAGVAILFSTAIKAKIIWKTEIEPGRLLVVRVEISNIVFVFVNIYAPNKGNVRSHTFNKLEQVLQQQNDSDYIILGGDWNCTLNFTVDRNGEEPHPKSAAVLANIIESYNFTDVWRVTNLITQQHTWVKFSNAMVSAARLDCFYVSDNIKNRILHSTIFPIAFSDNKLITIDCSVEKRTYKSCYWRFNVKLLNDKRFCDVFQNFWETWKKEKERFESIIQWWDVGKIHIKGFCQQYVSHSTMCMKMTLEWFEKEINAVEEKMFVTNSIHLQEKWTDLKQELCSVLNVKVKTALVRNRFLSIKDMDGPTSYFFNLERKAGKKYIMYRLKDKNGHYTEDPIKMRQIAVDFYSDLYAMDNTDELNRDELLKDLPCISSEHKEALETGISFEELTAAVMSLSLSRSPGIDGLPTEFYRTFWKIIGSDYFEVVKDCIYKGILPKRCQRAVLALLPKKGDLTVKKLEACGFIVCWL